MKKAWNEPKLIVLVRNRSEESILVGCKVDPDSGPELPSLGCINIPDGQCYSVTAS